jgi:hypothetical protein
MANIFSNFGNKVGNAFTNLGQGGNLFNANPVEIAALSDEDKKRFRNEGLERFANSLGVAAAIGSGDSQRIALAQNKIRQTKIDKENARAKAEQEKAIENYKKNNPDKADFIDAILGGVPSQVVMSEDKVPDQSEIYKQAAARIKNIILNESIDSPNLSKNELDFYNKYINKQGFMSINEAIAASLIGGNSNLSNNSNEDIIQDGKTYSYVRTNEDGKKVYVNDGKEYVFQD